MADNAGTPFDTGGSKKARIEIIPLIDVIFFLLATFVLFTLSLNKIESMDVRLPVSSPPSETEKPDEPMILQVSDGTIVYINREACDMADVYPRVLHYKETTISQGKIPRVLITGDVRGKYGALIKVLDETKSAGVKEISFETGDRPRASGK